MRAAGDIFTGGEWRGEATKFAHKPTFKSCENIRVDRPSGVGVCVDRQASINVAFG